MDGFEIVSSMLALGALGGLAGMLTTAAGLGGGLFFTLVASAFLGPHAALVIAAPALLIGNVHRAWMFRYAITRRFVLPFAVPAAAGAALGGLITVHLSAAVIEVLFVLTFVAALVKGYLGKRAATVGNSVNRRSAPLAFFGGVVSATSGGGGLIFIPLMLGAGARGDRFVASAAVVATSVHVGRVIAYGAGGLVSSSTLLSALWVALAIVMGNWVAKRLIQRHGLSHDQRLALTLLSFVLCGVAAFWGMLH